MLRYREYGAYRFRIRDIDFEPVNTVEARSGIGHALAVHIEDGNGCPSLASCLAQAWPIRCHPQ